MFNNAGISGASRRFLDDDLRDFDRVMGVNLFGVMVGSQRAARHMAEHGGGSIINTTSIAGINAGARADGLPRRRRPRSSSSAGRSRSTSPSTASG